MDPLRKRAQSPKKGCLKWCACHLSNRQPPFIGSSIAATTGCSAILHSTSNYYTGGFRTVALFQRWARVASFTNGWNQASAIQSFRADQIAAVLFVQQMERDRPDIDSDHNPSWSTTMRYSECLMRQSESFSQLALFRVRMIHSHQQ